MSKESLDGASVARLLEEEAEDVRLASMLADSVGGAGAGAGVFGPPPPRFPLSESLHHAQKDLGAMPVGGDRVLFAGDGEEPSSLSPFEVAMMMHHLEHGVSMTAPPQQLFKFLFPNASKAAVARKSSTGEGGGLQAEGRTSGAGAPNENTLHKGESCPIVCFGTGFSISPRPYTRLQLRGETPPKWFPGYFVALPETGGALQVKQSPAEVMQAAYMAARPRNIPPECRFVY
ncbi:Methylthioribose-1-phosphate isomerase [Frankliniella fusca]|uniref:Methylthioribose-1-phosphate isomerase n=1 Tax=Frankliniella fusca TaxID=407009 RepID=A0AAE1I427_9NEOP|nr:Methylthioribose-1-phosphate isomerase [Frankliniella fusca]